MKRRKQRFLIFVLCAVAETLSVVGSANARASFMPFDPAGSVLTGTEGISAAGVTGFYEDTNNVSHGFIRSPDGTITSFDAPNSVATAGFAINGNGTVNYGFIRDSNGSYTTFSPSGSTVVYPTSINERGDVAGYYLSQGGTSNGFVRNLDGTITSFNPYAGSVYVYVGSINKRGDIVGIYLDSSYVEHGFRRTRDGAITTIDEPNAVNGTVAYAIDDQGTVSGDYGASDGSVPGFLMTADGEFTEYGYGNFPYFESFSVKNNGEVAGVYLYESNNNEAYGFRRSAKGKVSIFEFSKATATWAYGVSGSQIAGAYQDSGGVIHGYVRTK